jgi:hypothetical protein
VQYAYVAPSRRHWNLVPLSFELKEKLALVLFVGLGGLTVIDVLGGVVSAAAHVDPAGRIARRAVTPMIESLFTAGAKGGENRPWSRSARPTDRQSGAGT